MNCIHCDYLLFNLPRPVCPECGQAFNVEWYRFAPGVVSFHCPHCDQQYFGNDAQGLPYPRSFTCVRCGQPVTIHELRVVPEREDARGELAVVSPWDDRPRQGLLKAWFASLRMILFQPSHFFRQHRGFSLMEGWIFALLSAVVGMVPYLLIEAIVMSVSMGSVPGLPWQAWLLPLILGAVVGPPVAAFVGPVVQAAFIHLGLLVLAPRRKSFTHTICTAMYASAPNVWNAVPLCGPYVGAVWTLVVLITGISEVHQTSGARAALAVLWPLLFVVGMVVLVMVFWLGNF
ncbi:MAG TPA: YIP1 family protein [Phycisphaerae bacterium]|nr:YIP1 family protein [Phycisphaerae bacterium]HNU43940.1 YIP1 family protein [Phycisphaerae bacterium]